MRVTQPSGPPSAGQAQSTLSDVLLLSPSSQLADILAAHVRAMQVAVALNLHGAPGRTVYPHAPSFFRSGLDALLQHYQGSITAETAWALRVA